MIKPILSILTASILLSSCAQKPEERQIQKEQNKLSLELEGTTYPYKSRFILALRGKVDNIYKKVGDYVYKDDPIFSIDKKLLEEEIKRLEYELYTLKKERNLYSSSTTGGSNPTVVHLARINLEKVAKLYSQGNTSEERYNEAKNTYANALFNDETQKNNSSRQRYLLDKDIEQKKAELNLYKEKLENSTVKAQINGFIESLDIYQGYETGEGQKIGNIIDISKFTVKAGLATGLLNYIKVGQLVNVSFITNTYNQPQTVPITRIIPLVDPEFGRIIVECEVNNINNTIQPLTKTIVKIPLSEENEVKLKTEQRVEKFIKDDALSIKSHNK